jgi:PPE-repeat protein
MKMMRYGLMALMVCALLSCGDSNEETTNATDSTATIAPIDNTTTETYSSEGMSEGGAIGGTPGALPAASADGTTGSMNTGSANTGSTNTRRTNTGGTSTGNTNAGSSNTTRTSEGTTTSKKTGGNEEEYERSAFEGTGHYNSNIRKPKPMNLDHAKYDEIKPAHTYGDTAPKARPSLR